MSVISEEARGSGIQVIARAAEMFRLLQAHPGGLNQAEIGERLGMARSTVSRILNALDDEGLVASRAARGRIGSGPEIARMATTVRRSVVTDAHPFMEELSRELEETVDLSILDGDRATFVDQVVSPHRLRAISAVGESFPLHCCANGKALLANSASRRAGSGGAEPACPAHREHHHDAGRVAQGARPGSHRRRRLRPRGADRRHLRGRRGAQGVSDEMVAVSVPVPAQRFYRREAELAQALLAWVEKVERLVCSDG